MISGIRSQEPHDFWSVFLVSPQDIGHTNLDFSSAHSITPILESEVYPEDGPTIHKQ